ncbi:Por secretion system C-terminal sorting domain-containing protein [Marivirga sericea]|uniref:Por secretion system C-terminal sorting domain-containing protein n=1 Tax=Marivirga sericea TaxID=1028 RepID=A0A1X7IRX0_9BACT|nr:M43 family zinc metalloprotease [Marivirga sericea]SMG17922.1 Por secretion system C-terminal sorting domain-containing protein [Marivirga sericea]
MKKLYHSYIVLIIRSGILLFFSLLSSSVTAQERCAVPQILEERERKYPELSTEQFENWIANKKTLQTTFSSRKKADTLKIPVVFHIIHNGEPIGIGGNLSKSRIDRQLEILNEDFNRTNSDSTETLDEFKDIAAAFQIEFIYAKQSPDGQETDGIVRIPGSEPTYSYQERSILSSESYWPAEEYLNIWVADLAGGSLGWAEFPVSNLVGLEEASNNRLIDGVSLDYEFLGDNPNSPTFESRGRTATHEMGHFFGLRHIWGDGGCSVDDFCDDTPEANSSSTGCNLTKTTCGSLDMVQNFMDYTNDECMNIFTLDQKERVRTVVENSPRRLSLTTSKGLESPPVFNRDLGLTELNSQFTGSCSGNFNPQITIKNQGIFPVEEYSVQMFINGILEETVELTETLESNEQKTVYFSLLNFEETAQYSIFYQVNLTGGFEDERMENNQKLEYYQRLEEERLPYEKKFQRNINPWFIRNADQKETWQLYENAIGIPFYENRENFGQKEEIISPVFDFTTIDVPELSFVFAQAEDSIPNRVSIYASYDCGRTFNDLVFSNTITDLSTAYEVDSVFTPQVRLDWDTVKIDLNRLKDEESVCFNIVAENRLSNNFYISEFKVKESNKKDKEIEIVKWEDINPLFCDEGLEGILTLKNIGREFIGNYTVQILNQNDLIKEYIINDEVLTSGQNTQLSILLPKPDQNIGEYEIRAITNDAEEEIINTFYLPFENNCFEELPPLRLSLRESDNDNWFDFNPNKDAGWTYSTDYRAVTSNSSNITKESSEDWLISPLLDVSNTNYLGLIFDVSYRKPFRQAEKFEIYISDSDGKSFNSLIYSKEGDSLATSFGNNVSNQLIWRNEFVDLSPFVFKEKIRLAFKVTHDNGQNVFLKNITFFVGQSPPPPYPNTRKPFVIYPNPAKNDLNLHLNLDIAEQGFFQILDMRGKVMLEFTEPKILNQFISFNVSQLAEGMYILRLNTKRITATERFMIQK